MRVLFVCLCACLFVCFAYASLMLNFCPNAYVLEVDFFVSFVGIIVTICRNGSVGIEKK